ncbi:hypothetical protein [Paraburkholderia ginsengiterrae]|uniref:hypothetical protein n=1 Tax=Paraburkholderia ginsengiterrae TaxID=1462993 RepID=UPI001F623D36|nr:hypothetical protein [Paraburkholderia ginsengiterrae]
MATEIVEHNIPRTKTNWEFDCDAVPLYICSATGAALDAAAYSSLKAAAGQVDRAWRSASDYLLSGGDGGRDHVLVCVDVPCECGRSHKATFYAPKRLGADFTPLHERCLLGDIRNTRLEGRLNGLFSKTEIMQFLEKLVIRWHLTADRILIAAPFVGHQYMKTEDKRRIWDWLIRNLDTKKSTLLTRKATYTSFKKTLEAEGLDYDELQGYGLEDKLISGGVTKQDFHAKFYAGLSDGATEVLSGSANLLRGPSIENISFATMTQADFTARYLEKLKVAIPTAASRRLPYEIVKSEGGSWICTSLDAGRAPWLADESAK